MQFTYHGPEIAVEVFGIIFPRGQAVQVDDPKAQAKLSANPAFKAPAVTPAPAEPIAPPKPERRK